MADIYQADVGTFLNAFEKSPAVNRGDGVQESSISRSSRSISLSQHPAEEETSQASRSGTALTSLGNSANAIHQNRQAATLKSRVHGNVDPQQGAALPDAPGLPRLKSRARFIAGSI